MGKDLEEEVQVHHVHHVDQIVVEDVAIVVGAVINRVLRILDHVVLHLVILIVHLRVLVDVMVMDALNLVVDVGLGVHLLVLVLDVPVF